MLQLTETHPNTDVIRAYWNATTTGNVEALRPIVAEDAVFHYPGNHFISGDYRGKDEVVGLYTMLTGMAGGTFEARLHGVAADSQYAVAILSYHLNILPKHYLPGRACGLFRVADGQIHEYWLFEWDQLMINDVFRTLGMRVALQHGKLGTLVLSLPRSLIAAARTAWRLFGGTYRAPTDF
ncbi:nuclear transport factor 2 family protein [Pyxidicoccus parkwayensis]|uniref:Nuclear transport factor 2 family protein n=1 Tax=Pyxidicoccus parkwayensis TaxID=2813578 RepID=A0ABX7NRH4_9BACT|nr:nuclear transport factor 2 family protein [Pyxidicoccus parkwaysis]QSQ20044.1 nuclear transport factor 2 family protein [Pyxidicoccus parkwaysis]